MEGYIKVHRKIMESSVWQDPYYFKLWMYCLMKASYKEREVLIGNQLVKLSPGEFVTGRNSLADDLNKGMKPKLKQSEITWWRYLNNLEQFGMLNIKKTNKYSVVSVVNWSLYQETEQQMNINRTTDEQQENNNGTTDEQQLNTNNNVNKGNKDKKVKNVNKVKKNKYAESVTMTEEEYQKLVDENGEYLTKKMIETLDNYKGSSGRTYKSDYKAILSWVKDKVLKESLSNQNKPNSYQNDIPRAYQSLKDWADAQ